MKRYIRSSETITSNQDVVMRSDDGLFEVVTRHGVGINNTPWTGYEVKSLGDANEHVVEIRLRSGRWPEFNGEPVEIHYNDVEVAHGMRSKVDTLEDTARYIEVLQSALEFAKQIKDSDIIDEE